MESFLSGFLDPQDQKNASFFSGRKVGNSVVINRKFPETNHNNHHYGYYDDCDTITRFAVDELGFVYINTKDKYGDPIVLCYGWFNQPNQEKILTVGVGEDAMSAKADMENAYPWGMHIYNRFSSLKEEIDNSILEMELSMICSKERNHCNLLPRAFTWHFGMTESAKVLSVKKVIFSEGEIHLTRNEEGYEAFQVSSNNFSFKVEAEIISAPEDGVEEILLVKNKPTKRNSNRVVYTLFVNYKTLLGNFWEGYETQMNPYLDSFAEVISATRQKIAENKKSEINSLLGRGDNPFISAKKYFAEKGEFSATPADSRAVGNCATGTWDWMSQVGLKGTEGVETPSVLNWENFPVPLNKLFAIPADKAEKMANENYRFRAVMNKVYFKTFPEKEGLKTDQIQKILFLSEQEALKEISQEEYDILLGKVSSPTVVYTTVSEKETFGDLPGFQNLDINLEEEV